MSPRRTPRQPAYLNAVAEHVVARCMFRTPDGQVHQTSVTSTLTFSDEQAEVWIDACKAFYGRLGYEVIQAEHVTHLSWEI